jgi:fumarylpyruvate hydrolase
MGGDPGKTEPVFFSKPADAIVCDRRTIAYPLATADLHHEVELVVALDSGGVNMSLEQASACIFAYAVGIDFTRRDLQAAAKKAGRPWDVAKGFDDSAPLSALRPAAQCGDVANAAIWLSVNGKLRQDANTSDLIWSVPAIIQELSRFYELRPGDLVFTGTPSGVSAVGPGDAISAGVDGVGELELAIVERDCESL